MDAINVVDLKNPLRSDVDEDFFGRDRRCDFNLELFLVSARSVFVPVLLLSLDEDDCDGIVDNCGFRLSLQLQQRLEYS